MIKNTWVRVEDCMPEEHARVIVYNGLITDIAWCGKESGDYKLGFYRNLHRNSKLHVTHWMPLPEAPKEK